MFPTNQNRSISCIVTLPSACAAVLLLSAPLAAQENAADARSGLSGSIGIGAISTQTYEGSPNRRVIVGPDFSLAYHSKDWGSVELGQRGLVWHALEAADVRLGLVAGFDPGRKTKDTATGDPTPGDKRLVGMGDVQSSPEAGVLLGYGPFSLLARKAVGTRGHEGTQLDFGAEWSLAVTHKLGLRFGASLSWADSRYMQSYFGVTSAQAQSSGFPAYAPGAGIRKYEASAGAEYAFADDWKLQGALVLSRLTGDASDSPVVARSSSATASVSVVYAF